MDNLIDGSVDANLVKYVNIDNAIFEKFKLEKGDVLFNRTNSYEYVGRTSIFNLDGDYVFASYLIRLKVNIDLADPHFLTKYLINCNDHLKQIATRSIQQANINAKNLSNFEIILPPINEQKEINDVLEEISQTIKKHSTHLLHLSHLKKKLTNDFISGKLIIPKEVL